MIVIIHSIASLCWPSIGRQSSFPSTVFFFRRHHHHNHHWGHHNTHTFVTISIIGNLAFFYSLLLIQAKIVLSPWWWWPQLKFFKVKHHINWTLNWNFLFSLSLSLTLMIVIKLCSGFFIFEYFKIFFRNGFKNSHSKILDKRHHHHWSNWISIW